MPTETCERYLKFFPKKKGKITYLIKSNTNSSTELSELTIVPSFRLPFSFTVLIVPHFTNLLYPASPFTHQPHSCPLFSFLPLPSLLFVLIRIQARFQFLSRIPWVCVCLWIATVHWSKNLMSEEVYCALLQRIWNYKMCNAS